MTPLNQTHFCIFINKNLKPRIYFLKYSVIGYHMALHGYQFIEDLFGHPYYDLLTINTTRTKCKIILLMIRKYST